MAAKYQAYVYTYHSRKTFGNTSFGNAVFTVTFLQMNKNKRGNINIKSHRSCNNNNYCYYYNNYAIIIIIIVCSVIAPNQRKVDPRRAKTVSSIEYCY